MAEHLTDETPRLETPEATKETWVDLGVVFDRNAYMRDLLAGKATSYQDYLIPKSSMDSYGFETSTSEDHERRHLSDRAKKRLIASIAILAVGGLVGGIGAYTYSQVTSSSTSAKAASAHAVALAAATQAKLHTAILPDNGITMSRPLAYGQESLQPQYCELPTAVYGVWTVNGTMNLEPEFNNSAYPHTLVLSNPYMTPGAEGAYLPKSKMTPTLEANLKKLKNYNTSTGYPEVTLNNLPLGLTICDLENAITVNKTTGQYFIDRSKLQLKFEGPNTTSMLNTPIDYVAQDGSANNIKVDPSKGEDATLPDIFSANGKKDNNMFIPTLSDPVFNASRAKFLKDVQSPAEVAGIIALAQENAVKDLNVAINNTDPMFTKGETFTYIDGNKLSDIDNMQDSIDYLLMQRLGVKEKNVIFTNSYTATNDTPIVPNTTKEVTDPSAGVIRGLKTTDLDFNLTNVTIQFGSVKVPVTTQLPTVKSAP
jgi:hypothetical protein